MMYRYSNGSYKWSSIRPEGQSKFISKSEGDVEVRAIVDDDLFDYITGGTYQGFVPSRIVEPV